jgi:hypothetical protein
LKPSLILDLLLLLFLTACATRSIYVDPTTPVRLAANVPNVPVWVRDSAGTEVKTKLTLREGQYVLTPSPEK